MTKLKGEIDSSQSHSEMLKHLSTLTEHRKVSKCLDLSGLLINLT